MTQKWEYKTAKLDWEAFGGPGFELPQLDEFINQYGDRGWELVAVSAIRRGFGLILFFKRPVSEE